MSDALKKTKREIQLWLAISQYWRMTEEIGLNNLDLQSFIPFYYFHLQIHLNSQMDKNHYFSRRVSTANHPFKNKQRLSSLCLGLKRILNRKLISAMESLKKNSHNYAKRIERMEKISSINSEICVRVAWAKIKSFSRQNKSKNRIIKDAFILGGRIEKWVLKQSFFKLKQNIYKNNTLINQKYFELRKNNLGKVLKNLVIKNKKIAWTLLHKDMLYKRQFKRVKIINTIFKEALKRNLMSSWLRLSCLSKKKDIQSQDFEHQLQDMKIQVENKNANINRLQQQIRQLKQSSSMKFGDQSSFIFNNSFGSRSHVNLQRSRSKFNNSYERDSNDGSARENSFGSVLGTSYISGKSKISNAPSKTQQCPCANCIYRQKYQKYKATNQTLKKQLQIIKTELEFTKDMNEHMQNEIKANFCSEDKDRDNKLEKTKNELRECQKDRQLLRQKVLKYQKYVAKLKQQFKTKIQQIYRRVKKTT